MSRYTPTTLAWGNTTAFVNEINANFDELVAILDDLVSRSGSDGEPNTIETNVDFNSNDINNVGTLRCDVLLIDNAQIPSLEDLQEAFADFEIDLAAAIVEAETALDDDIAAADTTFQGYLTTASGYVDDAENAQDAAEVAQGLAEAAQAGAELAEDNAEAWAAGVNLPAVTGGDAGKRLQVNSAEDGYELVPFAREPVPGLYDAGSHSVYTRSTSGVVPIDLGPSGLNIGNSSTDGVVTIGSTASASDYTYTGFNFVPSHAKGIIISFDCYFDAGGGGTSDLSMGWATYEPGDPTSALSQVSVVHSQNAAAATVVKGSVREITIPLAVQGVAQFEFEWFSFNATNEVMNLRCIGYTY